MNCTILLIDDHALFRAGLRLMLANALSDTEIREAASLDEALAGGRRSVAPQLILLDIQMPGLNGLDGMTLLARQWPDCPVIVLSADSSVSTERSAMERGAHSFLSKAAPAPQFLETVRTALAGQRLAPHPDPAEQGDSAARLTARQCEVLALLCQGLSNKLIGQRLHLSENTVRGHVQAILAALGVSSRAEAAFAARTRGLVG
ncbi:response regulator transcription factor [Pseudoduganella danionis]|uniref:Response regulator n=1 Tax=Pseudoduganella danionis TaxID=1890295 RepID=A0ABW9SMI1_9BURK|nr:response regulator transcription factor [Pseudoduganella danionis]MTW33075.1 response regulator [Pseudoduganella danionis]